MPYLPFSAKSVRWLAGLGVAASIVGGAIFLHRDGGEAPRFRSQPVTRGPLVAAVSSSGTLNAVVTVQVGSQISGQIREILADFNTEVEAGQVIARLDPAVLETRLAQAAADLEVARAGVRIQEAALEKSRADVLQARAVALSGTAEVAKAEAGRTEARRDLERKASLAQKGVISEAERDKAQAALDSAAASTRSADAQVQARQASLAAMEAAVRMNEAQIVNAQALVSLREAALRQAQVDLDHTVIRAPVGGTVIQRNIELGQTVAASLQAPVLFTIAENLAHMQVETSVDEADVGRVRVGQEANFTVDSLPGQAFSGKVRQIRKAATVVQNVVTYTVIVSAENPNQDLLPGMTANVRIVTDRRDNVLKIPNAALRFRPPGAEPAPAAKSRGAGKAAGGEGRVHLPEGAGTRAVPVRLGIGDGQFTEALEGDIKEGDAVIVATEGGASAPTKAPPGPRFGF
ncbi:MAG: efflux RND transporter periplasmic adaptor subunit [Magnetospirillum sp. WYHS-4]